MTDTKQKEIQKEWIDRNIKISICCITYNHEKYINIALDSFLSQKTNVAFEILIGDDKSTDSTLNILKEYQAKFPDIIKVVTSERKLGANGNILNVIAHAQGKYIAFCEGDDFWIDNNKIQKQYDLLLQNSDVKFCFHPAYALYNNGTQIESFRKGDKVRLFSISDVLSTNGQFAPTSSYMFKKEVITDLPCWFESAPIGDFFIELYSMKDTGGIYMPTAMSVYRLFSENSWSSELKKDFKKNIDTQINIVKYSEMCINDFEKYEELFSIRFARIYCDMATKFLVKEDYKLFQTYLNKSFLTYPNASSKQKLYIKLKRYPSVLRVLHEAKALLNNGFR